jgi:hypothetical protein
MQTNNIFLNKILTILYTYKVYMAITHYSVPNEQIDMENKNNIFRHGS